MRGEGAWIGLYSALKVITLWISSSAVGNCGDILQVVLLNASCSSAICLFIRILDALECLSPGNFKFVVIALVQKKNLASDLRVDYECDWEDDMDGMVLYPWENDTMRILFQVFGLRRRRHHVSSMSPFTMDLHHELDCDGAPASTKSGYPTL